MMAVDLAGIGDQIFDQTNFFKFHAVAIGIVLSSSKTD